MKLIVNNEEELDTLALQILNKYEECRVFTFSGDLGCGKTTFIKYICRKLGVAGQVSSPTFALVNEYDIKPKLKIYHFDFYKIKNIKDAYDIGYEEYFYSGNYCFIEWPEAILELIPENAVRIKIEVREEVRTIRIFNNHIE